MLVPFFLFYFLVNFFSVEAITLPELQGWVRELKGNDTRLFRWSADEHTAQQQAEGACDALPQVAQLLEEQDEDDWLIAAADYCILCITDNPRNRAIFSTAPNIHSIVIRKLVSSPHNGKVSALGGQLIYISTFTNERNHQSFFQHGAVPALAKIVMNDQAMAVQKMWACSALQNMAASYCETPNSGRCFWEWTTEHTDIQLDGHDSHVFSDGTGVRKAMMEEPGLAEALIELACFPPIDEDDEQAAQPGYTAVEKKHDHNEEIVTWAAMAALKNLALEPTSKPKLEAALECACLLKDSPDWLEEAKSYDFIRHLRRSEDPCWIREVDGDKVYLCIDNNFIDQVDQLCDEFEDSSQEECDSSVDIFTGETATYACCACGGGTEVQLEEQYQEDEL